MQSSLSSIGSGVGSGLELIFRGGFMMIPLLISAVVALAVIIERIYIFLGVYRTSAELTSQILIHVQKREFPQASAICENRDTPIASVLRAGIAHFDNPLDEMELCMKNQAEAWIPRLEKRIEIIDTVITAAPLMGLLGTITGMMASFRVLSENGVNEPNAITGGVAEALIATATGLIIALFCLIAYNYLTARVKIFIYELESAASRLVEIRLSVHRAQGKAN